MPKPDSARGLVRSVDWRGIDVEERVHEILSLGSPLYKIKYARGLSRGSEVNLIMPELEHIPVEEAKQVDNIIRLTMEHLRKLYSGQTPALRGQHAKGHACVMAKLKVLEDLPLE